LAEEFAERMLRTMNEAALALMVSVGHRTGLFDAMAGMSAATSAEIASTAGLVILGAVIAYFAFGSGGSSSAAISSKAPAASIVSNRASIRA